MKVLRPALQLGLISAALMALSITSHREIWAERTVLLVMVWFAGGFFGALVATGGLTLLARLGWRRIAGWLRPVAFLPGFLLAGGLAFLIQNRIRAGGYELNPDQPVFSLVFTSARILAVFLFSVPQHLLPWMAPAMVVAGYALLPGPGKGSIG
ncbi:MAG: hypothetical protein IOC59_12170 [Methylobacterium sp.]|nr:hypothetical protein [Methylobacterium sp.]MCA3613110.1 hypothetical protein [Methylobacterium sp.]MCA3615963.1 hypothetical protein [Methylobacterium sp.]MCA3623368.1 hypothetical protein [Methylobacterium sp.]MCA3626012.1 hypothetical protein [Methylobacterium sp.]